MCLDSVAHHRRQSAGQQPVEEGVSELLCGIDEVDIEDIAKPYCPVRDDNRGGVFLRNDGSGGAHQAPVLGVPIRSRSLFSIVCRFQ